MAIDIVDLDGGRGSVITMRGVVTGEEYLAAMDAHLHQPPEKFSCYIYGLVDTTEVTEVALSTADVVKAAEWSQAVAHLAPEAIVALVAGSEEAFGLSRMWEGRFGRSTWETRAFRSLEEAKVWLETRVAVVHGVTDLSFDET